MDETVRQMRLGNFRSNSLEKIKKKNINLKKELFNNNSYEVLKKKLNSLVIIEEQTLMLLIFN